MHASAKPANPTSSHGLRRGKSSRNAMVSTAIIPSSIATFARTVMELAFISDGLIKGNEVTLKVTREQDGKTQVSKFKGTLKGDTIKGKIDSDWSGEMRNYPWNAKRSS